MYRQLGIEERLFWSYTQLRPVRFTLTANIIGSLHLEGLRQALAKVQHRHPLLNVKIALDDAIYQIWNLLNNDFTHGENLHV